MEIISTIFKSFGSIAAYRNAAYNWKWKAVLYFIIVTLISSAGTSIMVSKAFENFYENSLKPAMPKLENVEIKDGKRKVSSRKFLPGYILVEMDLPSDESGWKPVCSLIRRIRGVTGFVGTAPKDRPMPISADEARGILEKTGEIKGEKTVRARVTFNAGESVKIIDGPFASFSGTIEEVNLERNKLKVMVGIFGRATPVEVDLFQVEKI